MAKPICIWPKRIPQWVERTFSQGVGNFIKEFFGSSRTAIKKMLLLFGIHHACNFGGSPWRLEPTPLPTPIGYVLASVGCARVSEGLPVRRMVSSQHSLGSAKLQYYYYGRPSQSWEIWLKFKRFKSSANYQFVRFQLPFGLLPALSTSDSVFRISSRIWILNFAFIAGGQGAAAKFPKGRSSSACRLQRFCWPTFWLLLRLLMEKQKTNASYLYA